jgi:putative transposase
VKGKSINQEKTMTRKSYPSDLNDLEWSIIASLLPSVSKIGHPREVDLREILNAIFYWADNGIKWRAMPHDLPNWKTVYDYFRRWVKTGLWSKINLTLARIVRVAEGREEDPSLIMIDSQSVEMAQKGGQSKG